MSAIDRARVLRIHDERSALEAALSTCVSALGPVGTTSPLVDADGFPRADVDLVVVRRLRQQAAMLRNDLRAKEAELASALADLHAHGGIPSTASGAGDAAPPPASAPFAWIDAVSPESPASTAGLRVGDRILTFGSVRGGALTDLAAETRASAGRPIVVTVLRQADPAATVIRVELELTPRQWAGPGLLGCHVLPCTV